MSVRIRLWAVSGCVVLAVALVIRVVLSSLPANLSVTGIPGGSMTIGREGTSDIFAVQHLLIRSFYPSTGLPSGLPEHGPLTVEKLIDKASPGLHEAMSQGRLIDEVKLDWYRIYPAAGQEEGYYVITLQGARIVAMETFVPTTFLPQNEAYRHMEGVEFIYRSIEWEWLTRKGDADDNGRLDLRDFAALQRCMPTSDADLILCLANFDFDDSLEISLEDYFEFATRMTGP